MAFYRCHYDLLLNKKTQAMTLVRKLFEKYDLIPTKPLANTALSTVVRVVSTYIVDMNEQQLRTLGEGLKDLGLEIIEASAKGAVEGLEE